MTGRDGTRTTYALAVRLSEPQPEVSAAFGLKLIPGLDDPIALAHLLRRQGKLLDRIGGTGLLLRITREDGEVLVRAILDHKGRTKGLIGLDRVPRSMPREDALRWVEAAEAYAAAQDAAVAQTAQATTDGRRLVFDLARVRGSLSSAAARVGALMGWRELGASCGIAASAAVVCLGLYAARPHVVPVVMGLFERQAARGYEPGTVNEDLAGGGTVRRLQGVAEAFGRRY
jgi:hypothetical protein